MTIPQLSPAAAHPFAGMDVARLLDQQASLRSDHPFLIWEPFDEDPQCWTYREFAEATKQLASGMASRGIGRGDFVLVHMENCPQYVMSWFACARLGAVAVTTNTRSAGDELNYYAELAGVRAAITQPKYASLVSDNCPSVEWVAIASPRAGQHFEGGPENGFPFEDLLVDDDLPDRKPDPTLPVCVMYTSGTTSRPKGVVWTHGNALWAGRSGTHIEALTPDDVHLVVLPLFHMNAMSASILPTLWVGATIVLQPKFSASRYWDVALRNRCTWGSMVPFIPTALLSQDVPDHHFKYWAPGFNGHFDEKFGVRCIGWWGMTETVSVGIVGSAYHDDTPLSVGRPSPFYEIVILSKRGEPLKPGESGELRIRGIPGLSLFDHYLNDPEATKSSFDDDGFFITGDRVRLNEDGSITFQDRDKDMLKVGGENVSAAEVERVVQSVRGVVEVAIVAKPDRLLNDVPVAFVRTASKSDDEVLEAQIHQVCEKMLADFKRPTEVRFVDDFPRATLGKVAKAKLREQLKRA